jgi:uncharacterized YccA/Bax inhibitor family protein
VAYGASPNGAGEGQHGTSNPALNWQSFERGSAEAGAGERAGMTAAGAYAKTGLLLAILLLAAVFGWSRVRIASVDGVQTALPPDWTWLAFILTFILGLVGAFAFKAAPFVGPLYALSEGALLGVASRYFNLGYQGIVLQAVLATVAVFAATLFLNGTGIIRVSPRFATGVAVAMSALVVQYLTAWLLSLFGVSFQFLYAPTPLGILLSVGIVILGALNLPLSFEFVRQAAARGAPKYMEWYAAYGLMLALIWIYVSLLRLLTLLRASRE